ncbi:MAG: DedA family protein, partial [Actinomycetota bacterium]|nr:DedA family protein [Actinomycetota bacterium]
RAVMPALAGLSRMPYRRFLLFNAAGGLIWGTGAVLLGYFAGNAYLTVAKAIGQNISLVIIAAAALGLLAWHVRKRRQARRYAKMGP